MENVLAIVLAGGAGERLFPLTKDTAKPGVPFGGAYRIVDFTLSNCVNSDVRRILILTQYKSLDLIRHIRDGWNIFSAEMGEYIEVLQPMKRVGEDWYQGTADAVFQNLQSIEVEAPEETLVLAGDHIYKMNYREMLDWHRTHKADITIGTIQASPEEAGRFGVVEIDPDCRVVGFEEKPQHGDPKRSRFDPSMISASMGVYVFNTEALLRAVREDAQDSGSNHDFGKDVIPRQLEKARIVAYDFRDINGKTARYWRDVGTLDAYYEANMDLISVAPVFNLYDEQWPIRTFQRQYPPAKFVFSDPNRMGSAFDSMVSSGSIISGGTVRSSIVSPDVRVNSYSDVEASIIFSHVNVGRHCRIRRAIIDRDVHIPEGSIIGYDTEADRQRYFVTESGITVVTRDYSLFENPVAVDYFTSE